MKKLILILTCLLLISGCNNNDNPEPKKTDDIIACTFGEECEGDDLKASELMDWEIINFEDSLNYVDGTHILFYSFDDCPFCKEVIPVLDKLVKAHDVKIYYVHTERDERESGNSTYDEVYNYFKDTIEENGYDKLYMPSIFFIKDGKVLGYHVGTVDGHDPSVSKMSVSQVNELVEILNKNIALLK